MMYQEPPHLVEGEHPVEKNVYRLPTLAIENMLNAVYGWVEKLTPGAMIYGKTRTGKSESIHEIMERLPELLGKYIPMCFIDCVSLSSRTITENQFYENLLKQVGYGIYSSGKTYSKFNRFVGYIRQRVKEENEYRFIIFLDEANTLHENQFKWFMGIHNILKKEGIYLIAFLVGQPELLSIREAFASTAQRQIIGRFMAGTHEFKGITSIEEMKVILKGYDETEFPENSGWSYSKYFLPIAFENGWRLQKNAEPIMECFIKVLTEETTLNEKNLEIPMQTIPPVIGYILQTLAQYDDKELTLDKSLIYDAIEYAEFVSWMKNVEELPVDSTVQTHH